MGAGKGRSANICTARERLRTQARVSKQILNQKFQHFTLYTLSRPLRSFSITRVREHLMSKRQRENDTMEPGPSTLAAETGMSEQELLRLIPQVCPAGLDLGAQLMSRNGFTVKELTRMSSLTTASTSKLAGPDRWIELTISPQSPLEMDWATHYPQYFTPLSDGTAAAEPTSQASTPQKEVEWADVGCGFGGLLMALAPQFPDTLMLGTP